MAIVKGDRISESAKLTKVSKAAFWAYAYFVSRLRDDFGRFRVCPRTALPKLAVRRPDITEANVARLLKEYLEAGLIEPWEADGVVFGRWSNAVEAGGRFHATPEPKRSAHVHTESCLPTAIRQARQWGTSEEAAELSLWLSKLREQKKHQPQEQKVEQGQEQGVEQSRGFTSAPSAPSAPSVVKGLPGPSAPPPRSRKPSWSSEACDDWDARYGAGSAPGSVIGAALKPLVTKHGWEVVRLAWQRYLQESTHPAPNANDFRSHFGDWLPGGEGAASPSRRKSRADVYEQAEKELERSPSEPEAPPIDPTARTLWLEVLEGLRGEVSAQASGTWLKPTRAVRCSGETLTVWCPSKTVADWIRECWGKRLDEVLAPRRLKLIHGAVEGG